MAGDFGEKDDKLCGGEENINNVYFKTGKEPDQG